MLPPIEALRRRLREVVAAKAEQGFEVAGLLDELEGSPESYDAMAELAARMRRLEVRPDWPFVEPLELEDVLGEADPARPIGELQPIDLVAARPRVEVAFLGSVAGCTLGKPLEMNLSLAEIRAAAERIGEWPLDDYVSEELLEALGRRHPSWMISTRGRIRHVPPDDDLNYTILGALALEQHGPSFTKSDLIDAWLLNLPIGWTWGPERVINVRAGMHSLVPGLVADHADWVESFNPGVERCGALIRVAAYGYACAGYPELAARLAWTDASLTHDRTGVYGAMFVASAIATAFVAPTPRDIFETALRYIPQRSRLYRSLRFSLDAVARSGSWPEAYELIHAEAERFDHCLVFQELGTVVNAVTFARDVGHGICLQVSQGNDTDSFGAVAGSILGAWFGPGHLDERWLAPFHDRLETTVATFHDHSLRRVARRMGRLLETTLPNRQSR